MYFDRATSEWTTKHCTVESDLVWALNDYVDCRCLHMSEYAVLSRVKNPDLIGYPAWFYVSCFICMVGKNIIEG